MNVIKDFDVATYDAILAHGLSAGIGNRGRRVCIEAAICQVLGLPHGDDPGCVAASVRSFKIALNDSQWSSPKARAKGLRDLGLAQLGSLGIVKDAEFTKRLAEQIIRQLIPRLFRKVFPDSPECLAAADQCERKGTQEAAASAAAAAEAAWEEARAAAATEAAWEAARAATEAAWEAARAAEAAAGGEAARAARAAGEAARAARAAESAREAARAAEAAREAARAAEATEAAWEAARDEYLILAANLALQILRDLKSPGCELLDGTERTSR